MAKPRRPSTVTAKGQMGVLIMNSAPSSGVLATAREKQWFTHPLTGQIYPRIQVLTIGDLLAGKRPHMPSPFMPYLQAQKFVPDHPTLPRIG